MRQQDGPKEYLLCRECEARFSKWESKFALRFHAHHDQPGKSFDYSSEEALCALSILWRVLAHGRLHPEMNHLTFGSDYSRTDQAFHAWQEVLLGESQNPGQFRAFWMFFDYIQPGHGLGAGANRFIFHASDFDIIANSSSSFAYAHIPSIFFIGALEGIDRSRFRGYDVSFKGGRYLAQENKIAPSFLFELIKKKMSLRSNAIESISPKQQAKIREATLADPELTLRSPLFRTFLHDQAVGE